MKKTINGHVAIQQPEFKKIEAEIQGGIARITQRIDIIEVPLVMGFMTKDSETYRPGDAALLRGDAGLQPWAKQVFRTSDGVNFVLCPESQIIGFVANAKY